MIELIVRLTDEQLAEIDTLRRLLDAIGWSNETQMIEIEDEQGEILAKAGVDEPHNVLARESETLRGLLREERGSRGVDASTEGSPADE